MREPQCCLVVRTAYLTLITWDLAASNIPLSHMHTELCPEEAVLDQIPSKLPAPNTKHTVVIPLEHPLSPLMFVLFLNSSLHWHHEPVLTGLAFRLWNSGVLLFRDPSSSALPSTTSVCVRHIFGFQNYFSSQASQSLKGSQAPVQCLRLPRCCWYCLCLQMRYPKSADLPSALPINHCPYTTTTNSSSFSQRITTLISWATKARNRTSSHCSDFCLLFFPAHITTGS